MGDGGERETREEKERAREVSGRRGRERAGERETVFRQERRDGESGGEINRERRRDYIKTYCGDEWEVF